MTNPAPPPLSIADIPHKRFVIENSIQPFSIGLQRFFQWVLENMQFEFIYKKYLDIDIWFQISPWLIPEMLSKIQSDPSSLGYRVFFKGSWKIHNLSLSTG